MPTANHIQEIPHSETVLANGHHEQPQNGFRKEAIAVARDAANMKTTTQTGPHGLDTEMAHLSESLSTLYSPAIEAKVWSVAAKGIMMVRNPGVVAHVARLRGG
jgi:hypothetical protein